MKKKLLIFAIALFAIIGAKESAIAAPEAHVHEYVNEMECNITHHWRECKWFLKGCPSPNMSDWDTFESHTPVMSAPDCTTALTCSVCKTYMGNGYPSHDIPIKGGKCSRPGCKVSCKHEGQKGVCQWCGVNLTDASANVYVHTHQWGSEFADPDFLYDSNAEYHWINCYNAGCPITDISEKSGYGAHTYSQDSTCATEEVCSVCDYVITIGYSSHDFSSTDGKCVREGCKIVCSHRNVSDGICNICGYTVPATDSKETDKGAETDKSPQTDKKTGENNGGSSVSAEVSNSGSDVTGTIADAGNTIGREDASVSVDTNAVNNKDSANTGADNESAAKSDGNVITRFFGRVGSFFKKIFK